MSKAILILGSALLLGAAAHIATRSQGVTIKEAYRDAFLVGSAVNEAIVDGSDSAAQSIVLRQFNTITNENVLKAERVAPTRDG